MNLGFAIILNVKKFFSIVFLCFIQGAYTSAFAGCFGQHISDALTLNKERRPLYSQATDGQSEAISRRLIRSEELTLAFAKYFDLRAYHYESKGVPVLCDGFVSMSKTPAFVAVKTVPQSDFVITDPKAIKNRIVQAYLMGGFDGIVTAIDRELEPLNIEPAYDCMVRHILLSIRRFALQVNAHNVEAKDLNLPSTDSFTWALIKSHLLSLPSMTKLDRLAQPLQSQGIPILCNDVPPL